MPKFIKLTPYSNKITALYVCLDQITYITNVIGLGGTTLMFTDGRTVKVMEPPEKVMEMIKES